jgi:hypothetical protein
MPDVPVVSTVWDVEGGDSFFGRERWAAASGRHGIADFQRRRISRTKIQIPQRPPVKRKRATSKMKLIKP